MPTVGKIGSADLCSWKPVGENRQRRFFDEHGLDARLSRPGRKHRQGIALAKQGLFSHSGQCWNRQRRRNRQSRQNRQRRHNRQQVLTMSLDGRTAYDPAARNESFNSLPYQHNSRCVVRYLRRRDLFLPGMAGCDYPAASFKSLPYRLQLLMGGLEACHGGEGRRRP